jgi:hypothetical protein
MDLTTLTVPMAVAHLIMPQTPEKRGYRQIEILLELDSCATLTGRLLIDCRLVTFLKPASLSPRQIESRKRIRAKGRKHYILYRGILRWGMSVFILTTAWMWHDEYGWHLPPRRDVWFSILSGLMVCSVAGYFWGEYMWRRHYEGSQSEISAGKNLPS